MRRDPFGRVTTARTLHRDGRLRRWESGSLRLPSDVSSSGGQTAGNLMCRPARLDITSGYQLLAEDADRFGTAESELDAIAADFHDGHLNQVTDHNPFVFLASEDQHDGLSHSNRGCFMSTARFQVWPRHVSGCAGRELKIQDKLRESAAPALRSQQVIGDDHRTRPRFRPNREEGQARYGEFPDGPRRRWSLFYRSARVGSRIVSGRKRGARWRRPGWKFSTVGTADGGLI